MTRVPLAIHRLGLGGMLVLTASSVFAQTSSEEEAEAYIRHGLELRRNGDDAAALAEFQRAQSLAPSPRARAQIGLALQALGRWLDAEQVQLEVLADESDPWVREHAVLLRESLATAQHHLGWLSVECNVAGAELEVNGAQAGTFPLSNPVRVVSGAVVIQVRAHGYEPLVRTVDVPAGSRARELFVLVASPPPEWIASREGGMATDPGAGRRTAGWVTLAAGGVLVGGGVAAAAVSAVYTANYNDDSRCFVWPLSRDQRCGVERGIAETSRVTAVVALTLGALAGGGGAFLLLTTPPRAGRSTARSASCRLGLAGIDCTGRF